MNRNTRLTLVAVASLLSLGGQLVSADPLPNDERVQSGTFSNGVKWLFRQHDNPPGKMGLMIHVKTGSLNETDAQQGLAHFMEHMCFNGTKHFAPGKLIEYFESIGMEFGADLNAFTSFDQTAYMLFTPDTETEQIGKALMTLSDYAFRALLLEEEIDKERGVVLEESRRGKSAFQRIRDELWPELFAGSRFAQRLPIGKDDVIANAPRSEFVDYYNTWYRPKNTTVLMVGDAEVDRIKPLIEKWFAGETARSPAREPKGSEFKPFTKERAMVVTDPEMAFCEVSVINLRPGRQPTTTTEQWRTELVEHIGSWIVNRRHEERIDTGDANYRSARSSVQSFFKDALFIHSNASGEPEDWAKMLEEVIVEVSRARQHGFTERELDLAKKEILADAERSVKTEPTVNYRRFLSQMLSSVNDEEPILGAQQELDLYTDMLPSITLGEVSETFASHFEPGTCAYVVEMVEKDGVAVPSRDDVLAAARAAWARKVDPPADHAAPTELLAQMPTPGKIVEKQIDSDLNITSAWLSNGTRLHHRFMDYKEDFVVMTIALAGGTIEETKDNAGVTEVATLAINEGATSRLTATNIRDIMTGKNITVRARDHVDSVTISLRGSPKDLEIGLQKVHALLTDGKIEDAAFKNWKLQTLQFVEMMQSQPRFKAFEAMEDMLSGSDPRRTLMSEEKVNRQSVAEAQAWFDRLRSEAPIEVSIVGEIKWERAAELVEMYIGSLPKRSRATDYLSKLRSLARPTGPLNRHIEVDSIAPKAMSMAGFMGCEGRNTTERRALELASNILTSRVVKRIREDLGIVYSIRARSNPSWIFRDSGRFTAGAPCDPDNIAQVIEEIHAMFTDFAENGPSEEELENAKKQIANNLDETMREPRYWSRMLQHHDLHKRDLNDQKTEKAAFPRFSEKQVQSVFAKYYKPERIFNVTAVPAKPSTDVEEKKEKATAPTP